MRAYHGSNRKFKTLRISKSLINNTSTLENEGTGIYFSTDINVARSYGKYIYELEINDRCIQDFRKLDVSIRYLRGLITYIYEKTGVNISKYINIRQTAEAIQMGKVAVAGICREVSLLLDCNEHWYEIPNYKIERIQAILRAYDKKHLKVYMFTYHIKGVGLCKVVDSDIVHIVNRYTV